MASDDDPQQHPDQDLAADEAAVSLRPWSAFAFRDYRVLWMAGLSILITNNLRLLSSTVWLFEETGSAAVLGLIGLVLLVVQIPSLLYGGSLADRMNRKRLMSGMQGATMVVATIVAVLALTDSLRPWHIFATTAVTGITAVISEPARSALTQSVVPRSHLMHAVTTSTLTYQIAAILSPLFFAAIASTYGLTPGFVMVAVTSIFGVVLPFLIRAPGNPAPNLVRRSIPHEIVDGFHFVRKHPILPGLVALDGCITVFSYYRETLPAFAAGLYLGGAGAVGVLSSANSIGAAVGSFVVLFLAGFRARGMLVLYASVAYGLILFPFGLVPWLFGGALLIGLLGATDAVGMTVRQSTVQLTTPPEMLGRALSFFSVAAYTANNVGTLWVGVLAYYIGVPNTMIIGGVLSLATVWLTARLVPGIRSYRYP